MLKDKRGIQSVSRPIPIDIGSFDTLQGAKHACRVLQYDQGIDAVHTIVAQWVGCLDVVVSRRAPDRERAAIGQRVPGASVVVEARGKVPRGILGLLDHAVILPNLCAE